MPQHSEQKLMPFTPRQLFGLVADIERYPEFLPWCLGARILDRKGEIVTADLIIGYKAFREKFTSIVTFKEPERISVRYGGGPLSHLNNEWGFLPASGNSCNLSFHVDFNFRSSLLTSMMDMFFEQAFRKMVDAFEKRAHELYD